MFSSYGNPDATQVVDVCALIGEFRSFVARSPFPFQCQVALSLLQFRRGTPVVEVPAQSGLAQV